jgi:hypothetical protein
MIPLLTLFTPLAQIEPSAAAPEQVALLFETAAFLASDGGATTTAMIAALAAGAIFCVLTIADWNRGRWGLVFPILMLVDAVILTVLGVRLYFAFAALQELNFDWQWLVLDPAERALLDLSLAAIASVGAWILAALSGALLFGTLGGTALIRAARARRKPPEHPEWAD